MADRSRIPVRVENREFPNFKEALRANGVLDKTTSAERTGCRKALKAGRSVTVCGITFERIN